MKYAKEIATGTVLLVCADIFGTTISSAAYYYSHSVQDFSFSTALLLTYALGGYALLFVIPLYIVAVRLLPPISKKLTALLAGIAWCPLQFVNPISCGGPSGWEQLFSLLTTAIAAVTIAVGIAWATIKIQRK